MSDPLHLTRVRLRQDADIRALAATLIPDETDARIASSHRLAWSLFAGDPARRRDFLWREEAPGRLIVLSSEAPRASAALEIVETRRFATAPRVGERLAFALRANPTASLGQSGRGANGRFRRGKIVDVVMQALHATPGRRAPDGRMRPPEAGRGRPFVRDTLLGWLDAAGEEAGGDPRRPALDWLARQGARHGFEIDRRATLVGAYRRVALPRRAGGRPAVFGQVDYEGALTVTDPAAFVAALGAGFGRAKAFGCGLMLLARAPGRP